MLKWLRLAPMYEFTDRNGAIRVTAGCSVVGHFEFCERMKRLWELLGQSDQSQPWAELYRASGEFRYMVDRLLELNGLKTKWFSIAQLGSLLFEVEGKPGWLVQINTLEPAAQPSTEPAEPATLATLIAGLGEDIAKSAELASELPVQALGPILEARAEMMKTPEEKAEAKQRKELESMTDDPEILELLNRPPTEFSTSDE